MLDYIEDIFRGSKLSPAVLAAALSACATESVLLNSERIERQFGSYGISVLASEAGLRRSTLYSIESDENVCRTYAIVRFTDDPDTSYGPLHAKVLAGNSLGEVFKSNGWAIQKQTLYIGSFRLDKQTSDIFQLMYLSDASDIALHVYHLLLAKDEQIFEYATIIEAHHPEYLSQNDLLNIYQYDEAETLSSESVAELIRLIATNNQ